MTVLMVEHRVEDVMRIRPERVMFMSEGEIRYLGNLSGLSRVVNYREVKLPAEDVLERAKADPAPVELKLLPTVAGAGLEKEALVKFENVAFGYEAEREVCTALTLRSTRRHHRGAGPNGAGKTTFVKHAIGLLKPKSGRVLVNGQDTAGKCG